MKVAFTSSGGELIDQHFGQAEKFTIWEISADQAGFVEEIVIPQCGPDEEDRISVRGELLSGCAIVYTMQIGGPAAAKLVARKIHPMKSNCEVSIAETAARLQEVLKGNPPPWLRKAMNSQNQASFEEE